MNAPDARILIVDDEAAQMVALCNTLQDHGYDVTGFTSAREAITALHEKEFDLLLTDLMLGETDGIALLRAAQEIDSQLVGIVMTGHGAIETAVQAMKAGALDYILKPFKLSIVLPVLSRALTVRRLRMENAELERRVRERTDELEAANKELEAFSYSVSHDLRAPLRRIDGFSHLLIQSHAAKLDDSAKHLLERVCTSAQHMGQLIDDLLQFSRLGRQPLAKRKIELSELVDDVLEELAFDPGDRDLQLKIAPLPQCVGDPALLRQVFVNLFANAFKFTRHREQPKIELGWDRRETDDLFVVRDNGAGFDMQYADKLFGVFQRLHRDEEFEGTGVGLSIVKRIIQRHGGDIWADAAAGKGAAFYFTLPRADLKSRNGSNGSNGSAAHEPGEAVTHFASK